MKMVDIRKLLMMICKVLCMHFVLTVVSLCFVCTAPDVIRILSGEFADISYVLRCRELFFVLLARTGNLYVCH
jgi:hypothetical protein